MATRGNHAGQDVVENGDGGVRMLNVGKDGEVDGDGGMKFEAEAGKEGERDGGARHARTRHARVRHDLTRLTGLDLARRRPERRA